MQESTRHLKSRHDTPANGLENPTDRATVDCAEFSLAQHSNLIPLRSRLAAGHRFLLLSVARAIAATRFEAADGDVGSVPWGTADGSVRQKDEPHVIEAQRSNDSK